MRTITKGATDQSVTLYVVDSTTGLPATLAYNGSGIDLWYRREGAAQTSITEATQTANGAHSDGGFVVIDDGVHRLDPPDAAFASGVDHVTFGGTATGYVIYPVTVQLVAVNAQDAVRGGMTALPNANAEAAGGLYTRGTGAGQINQVANGMIDANVVRNAGTAITASSGRQEVNVSHLGGDAQSLTDLKDFADAGYDPSTNKVEGVKLADATTTLTGHTPQTGDTYGALTGAQSEPTGVPAANETPLQKIGRIFMMLRNKKTVTETKKTYFDDSDNAEFEADISDDGTTYTESELNSI